MTFMQALVESANGRNIVSNTGVVYTPKQLNAKLLGRTGAVSDAVTTESERKGAWRIYDERKTLPSRGAM